MCVCVHPSITVRTRLSSLYTQCLKNPNLARFGQKAKTTRSGQNKGGLLGIQGALKLDPVSGQVCLYPAESSGLEAPLTPKQQVDPRCSAAQTCVILKTQFRPHDVSSEFRSTTMEV